MSACIKLIIKLLLGRANDLRNTPSHVTEARPMHSSDGTAGELSDRIFVWCLSVSQFKLFSVAIAAFSVTIANDHLYYMHGSSF